MMLANLANGGTYFFFAAFAILGFLTVCKYLSAFLLLHLDRALIMQSSSYPRPRERHLKRWMSFLAPRTPTTSERRWPMLGSSSVSPQVPPLLARCKRTDEVKFSRVVIVVSMHCTSRQYRLYVHVGGPKRSEGCEVRERESTRQPRTRPLAKIRTETTHRVSAGPPIPPFVSPSRSIWIKSLQVKVSLACPPNGLRGSKSSTTWRHLWANGSSFSARSTPRAWSTASLHCVRSGETRSVCRAIKGTKDAWNKKCL